MIDDRREIRGPGVPGRRSSGKEHWASGIQSTDAACKVRMLIRPVSGLGAGLTARVVRVVPVMGDP